MVEPGAPTFTEVTAIAETSHANPLYPPDAPLIRLSVSGQPDPITAVIARLITESGSAFLELPDGRLAVVLHLDGKTWIPRPCKEDNHS
jgi:hypothetical protein